MWDRYIADVADLRRVASVDLSATTRHNDYRTRAVTAARDLLALVAKRTFQGHEIGVCIGIATAPLRPVPWAVLNAKLIRFMEIRRIWLASDTKSAPISNTVSVTDAGGFDNAARGLSQLEKLPDVQVAAERTRHPAVSITGRNQITAAA